MVLLKENSDQERMRNSGLKKRSTKKSIKLFVLTGSSPNIFKKEMFPV